MSEVDLRCMHEDLEIMKQDISIIKNILLEDGELTEEAKMRLGKARKTPLSSYAEL